MPHAGQLAAAAATASMLPALLGDASRDARLRYLIYQLRRRAATSARPSRQMIFTRMGLFASFRHE